ncbi:MAG: DUF1822 family protein [Geminocystis sp.]|nr:DUF1822 family protein [Geminocystis sp.]
MNNSQNTPGDIFDSPTAIQQDKSFLPIPEECIKTVRERVKKCFPKTVQSRCLLNLLASCLTGDWLKKIYPELANQIFLELEENSLFSIWQFVNGSPIIVKSHNIRLIVLPEESGDFSEFIIPQEWVDIPRFRGDYFLPVLVDLEGNRLRVYGFVSRQRLKRQAEYNSNLYQYHCPSRLIEREINPTLLYSKYLPSSEEELVYIPDFSSEEKEKLMARLEAIDCDVIRCRLDFGEWTALFADDNYRLLLYQKYQPINLGEWLEKELHQTCRGWQKLQDLNEEINWIIPRYLTPLYPVSMRSNSVLNLEDIYGTKDEGKLRIAAQKLSIISRRYSSNKEKILKALNYIITNSQDEETRWLAAEGIWQLKPNHPHAGLWYGKRFNLGVELGGLSLTIVMGILSKSANQNSIFLRLYPTDKSSHLPAGLILRILDGNTEVFKELIAREGDILLQYKFWGNKGEVFWIQIQYQSSQLAEAFTI